MKNEQSVTEKSNAAEHMPVFDKIKSMMTLEITQSRFAQPGSDSATAAWLLCICSQRSGCG